jgi:putative endopeptidase
VELRDPEKNYNKMTLAELKSLTPDWSWTGYMQAVGSPSAAEINIGQPDFFKELDRQLSGTPLGDWKVYLRWHVIHNAAPALSDAFVQENFEFYGKQLSGTKELQPRWKRCAQSVNQNLGEALGEVYVQKYFPPEAKARAKEMVNNLIAALRSDIPTLSWMGPDTKKQALDKLQAFNVKIGYPDKWRDYSKLEVKPGDAFGNSERAHVFEWNRQLARLNKPTDRDEWGMTPQTINAYYNPVFNEVVFPAAILQPPFFDPKADAAVNYGAIGAVIGHEMGHGFDDQGAKSDAKGVLRTWWKADDVDAFKKRTDALADQYSQFEPLKGLHVNGRLTLGENIGDLGGVTVAHAAYLISLQGAPAPVIGGYTADQRFFLGWAQVWRTLDRDEAVRNQVLTNPHSPGEYRVNGVVRNVDAWYTAFGVKPGDKLYLPPDQRVHIW